MGDEIYRQNTLDVATVENNGVVVVGTEATMELDQPRDISVLTFIQSTYPALYNHVVRNMNYLNKQMNIKKKWSMRGGYFLLYRYVILFAILLCFCFGIASIYVKPCAVVPFVLSVLYLALSIMNIVIFIRNQTLINKLLTRQVPRGHLTGMINRFYAVPLNATALTGVVAAFIDPTVIAAAVRKENIQLTQIRVMLYDDRYLFRSKFPKEIIVHIFTFLVLFLLAILFVTI